ncbi:MAG: asparagine--tRNA ligase, partial [Bacteroidales bacterium]|nr:asparagine--tRNA ligase [Bacteroidales bacterium]
MRRTKISDILKDGVAGNDYLVKGWVRTRRGSKQVNFIALNDGSVIHNLQIVADVEKFGEAILRRVTTGASIAVWGKLSASQGAGQAVEMVADKLEVIGDCDANDFPLQPKKHSLEFLRENAHLRFRTNTFSAVARVRHAMIFAVHNFFTSKGFVNIHTPIITASDAEGAGEMFQVTTLDLDKIPKTAEGKVDFS